MPGNFYMPTLEQISHWPKANYIDPPEQRSWLGAFAIGWQVVATILVLGRLYLRINKRSGPFGFDDALIFVAWIFSIMFTVTACISDWHYNIGRHIWNFRPEFYGPSTKVSWLAQVFFLITTCLTKCSILLCHQRLAKFTYSKIWIYIIWFFMFVTIAGGVGLLLAYCFMCHPLRFYWDFLNMLSHGETGSCIDGGAVTIASGTLTIASDFWTAAIPCAMFYRHDVGATRHQKVLLNCLFCVGFLVTGVGCARTYYLYKIGHDQDVTWVGYDLCVASTLELQLAIICICAPFARSFFRHYVPEFTLTSRNRLEDGGAERGASAMSLTADTAATAVGRACYVTDEKGRIAEREYETRSPTLDLDSPVRDRGTEGDADLEWARAQVRNPGYIPSKEFGSSAESSQVDVEERSVVSDHLREDQSTAPAIAAMQQDEEVSQARSRVQEWVTKRPSRPQNASQDDDVRTLSLPNMSPGLDVPWR